MRRYLLLRIIFLLFVVINLLVLYFSNVTGAADKTKVAVLPFQMNADEDVNYISRAVRDMLTSRITYGTNITVVEQSLVNDVLSELRPGMLKKDKVQEIGSSLGVDYVIFGSIAKIGNNVSIDIRVLNVLLGGITAPVFSQSIGLDEVIPKMNTLAQGVNDAISVGFSDLPTTTTSIQPVATDGVLLEERSEVDEVLPERIKEVDLGASDGGFEAPETSSDEVETDREPLDKQSSKPEGLKEKLLKRKSEVDSLEENPVYQKSVNDLDKIPQADSKTISK